MTRLVPDAFIGREQELAALRDALASGARLVTVLGPPGIGKTRLARQLLDTLPDDGAPAWRCFCDVAGARSEDDVMVALSHALSVDHTDEGTGAAVEALARVIEQRGGALLVVDNFEPVARFAAQTLGRLLLATKNLVVLVTSRVRLRLTGEVVVEVEPLRLPAEGAPMDEVARSEAVLFLAARAQVDPAKNAAALHAIARRLEGVPLALALAAARLDALSAHDLLARLDAPLDVLTRALRDAEPRQATLRGALEASFQLLSDDEQDALARLSVFAGGFTLSAAEAVLGPSALDAIQALVEASLLNRRAHDDGGTRYGFYESIRAFAAEQLRQRGALDEARERQARHLLAHVDDVHARWQGPRDAETRRLAARLADEEVNLTAILKRVPGSADALRAVRALGVLSQAQGGALARLPLIRAALDDVADAPPRLLGWARYWRAMLARTVGRGQEMSAWVNGGWSLIERAEDPALVCAFLHLRATFAMDGLASGFDPVLDLGRVIAQAEEHGLRSAHAWNLLANVHGLRDDPAKARASADLALERARAEGDIAEEIAALATDAHLRALDGDFARALHALSRAALLDDEHVPVRVGTYVRWLRAEHLLAAGDLGEAMKVATELRERARAAGYLRYEAGALDQLALLHLERGHATRARELAERAVELLEVAAPRWRLRPLGTLAAALVAVGKLDDAERALAEQAAASPRPREDDEIVRLSAGFVDVGRARVALGEGELEEARASEERARGALALSSPPSCVVLRRLLERELAALGETAPTSTDAWPDDALVVDQDGAFYRPPGAGRVDTSRRPVLRKVLRALVDHHAHAGAAPSADALEVEALFAAAWPGEKATADAARARVRVAISTLRKEGLRDVIVTRGSAYALASDVRVLLLRDEDADEPVGRMTDEAVKTA